MPILRKRRSRQEEDTDVDMVPIMNMFLVLVPFLLMSASFMHIKAINTSVPVLGESSPTAEVEKTIKATVMVEIKLDGIQLTLNSDSLAPDEISKWSETIASSDTKEYQFAELQEYLKRLKSTYPASDTLIIIPDSEVLYDTIIRAMDVARYTEDKINLFPNVVISGKIT